jgi:hypothetical protein
MAKMHYTASAAPDAWLDILARFPPGIDINRLARTSKAIRRARGISDGSDLLRLGMARGPGGMSLQQTAAWAHLTGVAELSAPSLHDRLHQSVAFFAELTKLLLAAKAPGTTRVWSGRCLHLTDSSSISQPGSTGTDWRLHAVYDLGRGGFSHLQLTDRRGAETLNRGQPIKGEVEIADRGYAKARDMAAYLDRREVGARDFIVRVGWNALRLRDIAGETFDLIATLRECQADPRHREQPREWAVQALCDRATSPRMLPLRLIIMALPPDKTETRRKKLRRTASKHQDKLDPRSLLAAGFMILATSLPAEIPATEICAAYRLRWQIELAFKRLKSLINIDRIPTHTEPGGLSWLYPHLILALLTDDACQEFLAASP